MSRSHILYLVPTAHETIQRDSGVTTSRATAFGADIFLQTVIATLTSVAQPFAMEAYDATSEATTVESVAIISAIDINEYLADSNTITSISNTATTDSEDSIDLANAVSAGIVRGDDVFKGIAVDANSIISFAVATAQDLYAGVDAATETSLAQITALEGTGFVVESSTEISVALILSLDIANYLDPSPEATTIVTAIAIPSAITNQEFAPDEDTIDSAAVIVSIDIHQYPADAAIITSIALVYVALVTSPDLQTGVNLLTEAADTAVYNDIITSTTIAVPSATGALGGIDSGPSVLTPDLVLVPSSGLVITGPPTGRANVSATDIYTP